MNVVLLQDEIYLPSLGGATKANRFLLQQLAQRGHKCVALTRALTRSADGPRDESQLMEELDRRRIAVNSARAGVFAYTYDGVYVEAIHFDHDQQRQAYLAQCLDRLQPEWVLVADDKRRFMLAAAMQALPQRVILLLQTIVQLPFGPLALHVCPQQTVLMRQARGRIVISEFLRQYLQDHADLTAELCVLPFFGPGPFPDLARHDRGYITMINPCPLKGATIFLELAREFADYQFAAVPTWGATDDLLAQLQQLPNMHILAPADDIEDILDQTRVLLVPSLWPETFGYVVPEAMLRGIPVMASDLGGLREAKLGVDYLLPVVPAVRQANTYESPPQDTAAWSTSLHQLLSDPQAYRRCSQASRLAAAEFVAQAERRSVESFLAELSAQ